MTASAKPFAAKKFLEIKGRRMAYIDEGEGAPIVFRARGVLKREQIEQPYQHAALAVHIGVPRHDGGQAGEPDTDLGP